MSNFIVRVELYGSPSYAVYNNLHAAMERTGFSRTFIDHGKTYNFPHAVYGLFNSSDTTTDVLEATRRAAATIWADFAVLVTQTNERFEYYNLK